jgi:hypothetical protein
MKRLLLLLIPLISLIGCGAASNINSTANSNLWYAVEMRPSQIKYNGEVFYTKELNDKEYIVVFKDSYLDDDARYYQNKLWESYGWTIGEKMTASAYASRPKIGALHISIKRGVAVYINPNDEFSIYRVSKKNY